MNSGVTLSGTVTTLFGEYFLFVLDTQILGAAVTLVAQVVLGYCNNMDTFHLENVCKM